jgi:hypothetical protein
MDILPMPDKKPPLDALIDVIAAIEVDNQVSGNAALAALPATRRVGTKPFAVEGLNDTTGEWEMPTAGHRYHAFQAGIQLANRVGALNEIEFSEFVIKAQAFADAINGSPEFPDMLEEVARARELDQFASAHDAQLSFTVVATAAAWSPGYIHQHAARWGFVAGVIPGRMVLAAPVRKGYRPSCHCRLIPRLPWLTTQPCQPFVNSHSALMYPKWRAKKMPLPDCVRQRASWATKWMA